MKKGVKKKKKLRCLIHVFTYSKMSEYHFTQEYIYIKKWEKKKKKGEGGQDKLMRV